MHKSLLHRLPAFAGGALTAALTLAALLIWSAAAQAHGGGQPQLVDVPSGPYHLYVWTNPQPPQAGVIHITVALVQPDSQQPVLDAAVQVTATQAGEAAVISAATHDNATIKTYYETDMTLPQAGVWEIAVGHADAAGRGRVAFKLTLEPAPSAVGPGEAALLGVLVAALLLGILWWRKRRHAARPV